MPAALAIGAGLVGVATTVALAWRERRQRQARTLGLFDGCRVLFETSEVSAARDGYPRLEGCCAGRSIRLAAVPDTLTLKRLPQLWLSATLRPAIPPTAEFAILARPTGAEFFAIVHRLPLRLEVPAQLSPGLLARGAGPAGQALLDRLAEPLADVLADPRVKEVAVTARGLRLVMQASQGRRGEYLLLRQSAFEETIPPATVQEALDALLALEQAMSGRAVAPAESLDAA